MHMHIPLNSHNINLELKKYMTTTGKLSSVKLLADKEFTFRLHNATNFLENSASFSERIYCIRNNIKTVPICSITNKPLKFYPNTKSYKQSRCESYNRIRGKTNNNLSKSLQFKYVSIKQLLTTTYGTKQFKIIDKRIIKERVFNIKGNTTPTQIENDIQLWCNVLYYTQFIDVTNLTCWGERIYCIINNITDTVFTNMGTPAKYINSKQGYSKYTTKEQFTQHKIKEIVNYINQNGYTVIDKFDSNVTDKKYITIKCNKCNENREQFIRCGYWKNLYCEKCYGNAGRSKIEDDIINFISATVSNIQIHKNWIIPNTRKEIDIYLPDYNIGIELCGVLWHSYGVNYPNNVALESTTKNKHLDKLELARSNNIHLLTIFDSEWLYKQDKIKAMILSKLGKYNERLYGRNCIVRQIDKHTKRDFLNNYHLQGNDNSQYYYGLYNKDRLVSVMTFGVRQIAKGNTCLEMIRYCCLDKINIVGGASKLLKFAVAQLKQHHTIIKTYCDRRFSTGNFYKTLGFELKSISKPNFWITKDCIKLYHRIMFQRHKLEGDKDLTAAEILYSKGYRKIYDCGNFVYTLNLRN